VLAEIPEGIKKRCQTPEPHAVDGRPVGRGLPFDHDVDCVVASGGIRDIPAARSGPPGSEDIDETAIARARRESRGFPS
jgi:hypothetical protein